MNSRTSGYTIDFWRIESANGTDFQTILVHKNDTLLMSYMYQNFGGPVNAFSLAYEFVKRLSTLGDQIMINVTLQESVSGVYS